METKRKEFTTRENESDTYVRGENIGPMVVRLYERTREFDLFHGEDPWRYQNPTRNSLLNSVV